MTSLHLGADSCHVAAAAVLGFLVAAAAVLGFLVAVPAPAVVDVAVAVAADADVLSADAPRTLPSSCCKRALRTCAWGTCAQRWHVVQSPCTQGPVSACTGCRRPSSQHDTPSAET